jgi:hypothetical protein
VLLVGRRYLIGSSLRQFDRARSLGGRAIQSDGWKSFLSLIFNGGIERGNFHFEAV